MRILTAIALFAALPASAEEAASPLAQVLAGGAGGPLYAYDMTLQTPTITAIAFVDPSQEEGKRITLTSPAQEDWPKDFAKDLAQMEKEVDGDIWCAQFADTIPADAVLTDETNTSASYTFQPVPDPEDEDDAKFMQFITGSVTIDTVNPAILNYRLSAAEPFKPAVVAKINTFEMNIACERAPDGRTYISDMNMHIEGSAMMKSFEEKMMRKITALHPTK